MGCAASTATAMPLDQAQAVQPNGGTGGGGGGLRHSDPTAPLSASAATGASASHTLQLADHATQQAVVDASRTASSLFTPAPSADAIPAVVSSAAAAGGWDAIASDYMNEADVGALAEVLTAAECGLFAAGDGGGASDTLEISPQSLAELALQAGGSAEAVRLLRALDARGVRCTSMAEVPAAIAKQQEDEAAAAAALLPAEERAALLAARGFLARPTCALYPYAAAAKVASSSSATADPSSLSLDHHEDLELDFNAVNQQLVGARVRARFLAPTFLAQLVHAAGGAAGDAPLLVLQHLSLAEHSFELPSELLRGVLVHRAQAIEAQAGLRAKAAAQSASGSAVPVPGALAAQIAPLQAALSPVGPSCARLEPLMDPLIPSLAALTPTMRHLQAYLSRFLPLLQQSHAAAREAQVAPEDDEATAQILRAYLVPFLQLMQPWLLCVRPYLAGLQPFFSELQPFLAQTHAAFTCLQPFVHGLAPFVTGDAAPFLLDAALFPALGQSAAVLAALHPLLRQLHPLCQGLLSFLSELSSFLAQLQSLLDTLAAYQTLPLEAEAEPQPPRRDSLSSIAVPWFAAGAGAGAGTGGADGGLSAPRFLSKYGRFVVKLAPYVQQLRPFATDMMAYVENYAPFAGQLAPFYRDNLKDCVTPLLLLLVPVAAEPQTETQPDAAAGPAAATSLEAEIDEATLQRVLSS